MALSVRIRDSDPISNCNPSSSSFLPTLIHSHPSSGLEHHLTPSSRRRRRKRHRPLHHPVAAPCQQQRLSRLVLVPAPPAICPGDAVEQRQHHPRGNGSQSGDTHSSSGTRTAPPLQRWFWCWCWHGRTAHQPSRRSLSVQPSDTHSESRSRPRSRSISRSLWISDSRSDSRSPHPSPRPRPRPRPRPSTASTYREP